MDRIYARKLASHIDNLLCSQPDTSRAAGTLEICDALAAFWRSRRYRRLLRGALTPKRKSKAKSATLTWALRHV
ncbi:hypothetical protein ACNKHU_16310 [Shigella flexneri]